MPDLSSHFDGPNFNARTFARACRERSVCPYSRGMDLTIAGGDYVDFRSGERRGATETKWVVYFREVPKGLVVSRPIFAALDSAWGPDSDDWKGRRLTLYLERGAGFQKGEDAIRVRCRPGGASTPVLGEAGAERFRRRCDETGRTPDRFVAWLRVRSPEEADAAARLPVDRWPYEVGLRVQEWLQDAAEDPPRRDAGPPPDYVPPAPPPAASPRPTAPIVPGGLTAPLSEDDIPF